MEESLKNKLFLQLPNHAGAEITAYPVSDEDPNTNDEGAVKRGEDGKFYYYPPDEYNNNQVPQDISRDITKPAIRTVTLTLHFSTDKGKFVVKKPIKLARPPVVLVHGINNDWTCWRPLLQAINNKGVRVPMVTVNHWSPSYKGNGAVEVAAKRLQDTIRNTLHYVRYKEAIPFSDANIVDVFTDYQEYALAVKRVDIVAWSYGGVVTRWYTTSTGDRASLDWYKGPYKDDIKNELTQAPQYQSDVRKVITLGSMWRGVPLTNYLNEIVYAPSLSGADLGTARLNWRTQSLIAFASVVKDAFGESLGPGNNLGDLVKIIDKFIPTQVPSMEVMAVNSPWLGQLVYQDPFQVNRPLYPQPFVANIAYGSVAGYDSQYPIEILPRQYHLADLYEFLNEAQSPSWFPYLGKEYPGTGGIGFSDGIVPVWSSAIPGSHVPAPATHNGYASDPTSQDYIVQSLSNANLKQGASLNTVWANTLQPAEVVSYDRSQRWILSPDQMAPSPQRDVYQLVGGIGRILPSAMSNNQGRPSLIISSIGRPSRDGKDILINVTVSNNGHVLTPSVELSANLTTLVFGGGTTVSTFIGKNIGPLAPGQSITAMLRFPPALLGTGTWPSGTPATLSISGSSGYPGYTFGRSFRVVLPQ